MIVILIMIFYTLRNEQKVESTLCNEVFIKEHSLDSLFED